MKKKKNIIEAGGKKEEGNSRKKTAILPSKHVPSIIFQSNNVVERRNIYMLENRGTMKTKDANIIIKGARERELKWIERINFPFLLPIQSSKSTRTHIIIFRCFKHSFFADFRMKEKKLYIHREWVRMMTTMGRLWMRSTHKKRILRV